jgi:hypothetical protein
MISMPSATVTGEIGFRVNTYLPTLLSLNSASLVLNYQKDHVSLH